MLLIAALATTAAWVLLRGRRIEIDTASAIAATARGGGAAVLQATGYVTARRQATVSAQITGALTEVLIEEGEQVKAGQVLARLDDTAQRAALAQAQAQLKAAERLRVQYQAQLEQARRDLKRNQELVDADAVSRQARGTGPDPGRCARGAGARSRSRSSWRRRSIGARRCNSTIPSCARRSPV